MNPGGRGCSEPRSHHCTPAWATRAKLYLTKKERRKERKERKEERKRWIVKDKVVGIEKSGRKHSMNQNGTDILWLIPRRMGLHARSALFKLLTNELLKNCEKQAKRCGKNTDSKSVGLRK